MCRHIAAAPSPFREGRDGPCPFPFGPSHPSQKATVPRPLHLGPICCCWLPSLPPALNSDVFNHTHQRHRAAPREPQLAAHFLLVAAKRGAASWGTAGASLPRESDQGRSGCSCPAFSLQWHFGGSLGQLCPQTSTRSEPSCQAAPLRRWGPSLVPTKYSLRRLEKRKPKSPFIFASLGSFLQSFPARIFRGPCGEPHHTTHLRQGQAMVPNGTRDPTGATDHSNRGGGTAEPKH